MDGSELEDGEACAYQADDYPTFDPDVALSYIDDKIQNVLGHFKKDFEGVVSVENLGAKYGIYGSFLPSYRRSPIWSHSKTPPRVQNLIASQSPTIVQEEGGLQHSLEQANATPSVRHEYGSSADHKPPSQHDLCGQTTMIQSMQYMKKCTPKSEVCDGKTLKVRIKVGSDQFSGKKSAAIYNGLGLDDSPSSFENSPVESRRLSHGNGMLFEAHESPTQILQMMTSFPLYGGYLLSPLPYDLLELNERPKVLQNILIRTSLKANLESSVIGQRKDSNASYGDSVVNLLDRKGLPLQVKSDGKDSHVGLEFLLKKSDIDAVSCEELISDALKLPFLSSADSMFGESAEDSLKEKDYSRATKRGTLETSLFDSSLTDKAIFKGTSIKNVVHNEVVDANGSGRMNNNKGEAADRLTDANIIGSKSKKASKSKVKELRKQKGKNSLSCEGGKNRSSSGNKKKPKKMKAHGFATSKEAMENPKGCAWKLKDEICTNTANQDCRSESKNSLMQKQMTKVKDKYKDSFGELNELEVDLMDSSYVPSKNRLRTLDVVKEGMLVYENTSRERSSSYDISRAEAGIDLKGSPPNVVSSEDGWFVTDPASSRISMHERWVCCDKCHKKRLLPPGAKVDSLPKKWNCSMMTWLPDMNNCNISGEETTTALRARYWLPSEIHNCTPVLYERVHAGAAAADVSGPRLPKDEKLLGKNREMSMPSFQESPNQLQRSVKKQKLLVKDRTVIDAKESPLINLLEFDHLTKSDDTFGETNQHNKIDKQKADCDSDGGYAKIPMLESKRELDRDCPRICKKRKTRGVQTGNNGLATAPDEGNETSKDNLEDGSPNTNDQSSSPGVVALNDSKSGGNSVAVKKKINDHFQDPQGSASLSGTLISDDEQFKKEKHRVSKSEGKEHSIRNDSVLEPTSSSSKVSGSLEAKAYAQKLKGAPVQSVDDGKEKPKCNSDEGEVKAAEFCGNPQDQKPVYEKKETARKIKDQEKCGSNVAETEKDIICHKPEPSILKSEAHLEYDEMRCAMNVDAETKPNNLVCTSKREKSLCLKPSNSEQDEMPDCSQKYLGNGMNSLSTDASASNLSKELKTNKKADSWNGADHIMSVPTIPKAIKNQDAASPLRREASSEAARNALKEARNLKHIADRLKKSNGSTESTKFYFEAALKFLHGASLLESGKTENSRNADMAESMKIYTSTAKLCEFCAHEYERSKDMATAALAYKCMEVAYMRVIRISHESANRDRRELQTVLRIVPPGESPSSSSSDIDNLNNSVTGDKAPQARSSDSPQLAADLVIATRNCPNFERLLCFAQNVNLAMEASRKSRIAFTAANGGMNQLGSKEGITSFKRALDFNFHDVDGLLRLVRLAKDVTND